MRKITCSSVQSHGFLSGAGFRNEDIRTKDWLPPRGELKGELEVSGWGEVKKTTPIQLDHLAVGTQLDEMCQGTVTFVICERECSSASGYRRSDVSLIVTQD